MYSQLSVNMSIVFISHCKLCAWRTETCSN